MATSKIKGGLILSNAFTLIPWGTYSSSDSSHKTEQTLNYDIAPGSLLELTFGTDGKFRYMISAPTSFSTSDIEYNDFIIFGSESHTVRVYWTATNKIKVSSYASGAEYALRLIKMFV